MSERRWADMNIEEFLDNEIDKMEQQFSDIKTTCSWSDEDRAYNEGQLDTLSWVKDHLSFIRHDLTVKEVQDFCKKHWCYKPPIIGCDTCPLNNEACNQSHCATHWNPSSWDISDLEKRIREEGRTTREERIKQKLERLKMEHMFLKGTGDKWTGKDLEEHKRDMAYREGYIEALIWVLEGAIE